MTAERARRMLPALDAWSRASEANIWFMGPLSALGDGLELRLEYTLSARPALSPQGVHPVVVGISGASGSAMAGATIDRLLAMKHPVIATASSAARMVWRQEMDESFGQSLERWVDSGCFTYCAIGDLAAPIASGTFPTLGMAVVPCSVGTVAAIAQGLSDNLLRRAADVCLKERRPLVLVPRETPLSAIHLENMTKLARLGVTILPPQPAFYLRPRTIDDVVDFIAERTLLALGVTDALPDRMRYEGPDP